MADRVFFDTNILVYAQTGGEPRKRKIARKLLSARLADQTAVISTQVLQEYFVAATRLGVSAELAHRQVATYAEANVVQVNVELILAAIELHRLHKISFWDALIVRAARTGGCSVLLSEDLKDGQDYDGLRVENPFRKS